MKTDYDIAIVGGGMVGASLACALAGEDVSVALIEAVSTEADEQPSYDDRGLSLSLSSKRILGALGVWPAVAANANPIEQIHVSDRGHYGFVRMRAKMMKLDALGYIVVAKQLGQALLKMVDDAENVDWLCPARVSNVQQAEQQVELSVIAQQKESLLRCKLLVVADGANSRTRAQLGFNTHVKDYQQTAIVANVSTEQHHCNTAFERFTESGPFALLPLSEGHCVAVYTVDTDSAKEILALDDEAFLKRLEQCFGLRLGRFTKAGKRKSYPLLLVEPEQQTGHRVVLLGNAAHAIHPNGAQGFNLGLRDVAGFRDQLIPALRQGVDPGTAYLLEAYVDERSADQKRVIQFSDRLTNIFYNANPGKIVARDIGMLVTDLLPGVKKSIMRKMMGIWGRQPEFVQGEPV